jgi:hypothetical protein
MAAAKNLTPEQRIMRARIAAHSRWARERDRHAATEPARRAALSRFEREVDPNGELPPEQRRKLAQSAQQAHMTRLALASSKARGRGSAAA